MRILKKILFVLLGLAALVAGVGFLLPRHVHVERSTVIAAPPATVFTIVDGFRMFRRWSPWEGLDPDTRYTYEGPESGVGAVMAWTSAKQEVGSGRQTITDSRPYQEVAWDLEFGGQGAAKGRMTLAPGEGGTRLTWGLDADMGAGPLGRYFGYLMDGLAGKDFEKGLANLKGLAESLPQADFADLRVETVEAAPVTVAYVEASCGKGEQEIAAAIGAAYAQVGKFMAAHRLRESGPPITIDTRWDDAGYGFDAAIPVDRAPDGAVAAGSKVMVKSTYAGRALKTVHKGPYHGLHATYDKLVAYAAAHGYERPAPPWDEYVSDPGNTPESELVTNILMPVK